tara:strand:+ start:2451 stop:2753 length:303 start_codon:yes stop_codon:yes gene_type:complete
MLVTILCLIAGLMVGFLLSGMLRLGVETDMRVALLMMKQENKELRSQLHVTMLNGMPYECGNVEVKWMDKVAGDTDGDPDLIDLGPDHEGSLRFVPYFKG